MAQSVLDGLGDGLPGHFLREGEAGPLVLEQADAYAPRVGYLRALDLALEQFDPHALGFARHGVETIRPLAAGFRAHEIDRVRRIQGFHRLLLSRFPDHRPPTRMLSTLMVGWPTMTGTEPEEAPHMPAASSRSSPTWEMRGRISGPLPIKVAPRTGSVVFPLRIK